MTLRLVGVVTCALLFLRALPSAAQDWGLRADSAALDGAAIEDAPVDRVNDRLLVEPGVSTDSDGELTLRGANAGAEAVFVDGVPVLPGFRPAHRAFVQGLGTNAVGRVAVLTGALPVGVGNARSGAIALFTRIPDGRLDARGALETDGLFGAGSSVGFNRYKGRVGGALSPRLRVGFAAVAEAQKAIEQGFGADAAPVFELAGTDTTVTLGDGSPHTIHRYALARGDCETVAGSADPGIADNYGESCGGARLPATPRSTYQLSGGLRYALGGGGELSLTALAHQTQGRPFDLLNLYNPTNLFAERQWGRIVTLAVAQPIRRVGDEVRLRLRAAVSHQTDRWISGPLTADGEADTRHPSLGLPFSPLDFRFDFESFPLNDELVRNYRLQTPGSRRAACELENPEPCRAAVARFRDNPYGIARPFTERGGPDGQLRMFRENRWVGLGAVEMRVGRRHTLTVGGELTRYEVANYSHETTNSFFSDVYIEKPVRAAGFLEDKLLLGPVAVTAGLRYDWFDSRARRPDFPRVSSHPDFDPANPYDPALFPGDESHSVLSPRLRLEAPIGARTTVYASAARQAQVPDFALLYAGINTDLGATLLGPTFGTDLDFEKSVLVEVGAAHRLGTGSTVALAAYQRTDDDLVMRRLVSRLDPISGGQVDIPEYQNTGKVTAQGIEAQLRQRWGDAVGVTLAYTFQNADQEFDDGVAESEAPAPWHRKHTLAGSVSARVPSNWKPGTLLGGLLRNVEVHALGRVASGTRYSGCLLTLGNWLLRSGEPCRVGFISGLNDRQRPTLKQLDLRLGRGFRVGGQRLTAYVDARNLLNLRTVRQVFVNTGRTTDDDGTALEWAFDSTLFAVEAERNSARRADGAIDLTFGGIADRRAGCAGWLMPSDEAGDASCISLVRAEQRFGDGDGVFDVAEQRRAANALYNASIGEQTLTGPPRRVRIGLQLEL